MGTFRQRNLPFIVLPILLVVVFILGWYSSSYHLPQKMENTTSQEVAAIAQFCERVKGEVTKEDPQLFEEVFTEPNNEFKWHKVSQHGQLENVYTGANAFIKKGEVRYVQMDFNSRSGDWIQYNDYCFREDGMLAKVAEIFNTFQTSGESGVNVMRDFYFDGEGNEIASSTEVFDLKTREPSSDSYADRELHLYKTTRELPFLNKVEDVK